LITTLCPGDVVFDIGSHFGQYVIPLARAVGTHGQVFAFEPEGQACERLRSHIALNGLVNVRVFQTALGDVNQHGELYVGGSACPSLIPHEDDPQQLSVSEAVEIVRGDWLVNAEGLPIPRAVKIDVEGSEYSVLRGLESTLTHPACELLCCEIHPALLPCDIAPEGIARFVDSVGFSQIVSLPSHHNNIHVVARKRGRRRVIP
jgi:FkbM family methyltransferase